MTQDEKILQHLKDYGEITSWEAITEYGITRLSAIIHRLRQYHTIESTMVCTKNRYNEKVHFAKYKLNKKY